MAARRYRSGPGYPVRMLEQAPAPQGAETRDRLGRALRDLRISVTDRCNFRCPYCMPSEVFGRDYAFLPRDEILSYEEIHRLATVFVGLGVHKLRITGGEPTVRRGLPDLIAQLAALRTPEGESLDLALTTNGSALSRLARPRAAAGLRRVPVSLCSLAEPPDVCAGTPVSRSELLPPGHQRFFRMGLAHLGVVVGEEFDEFSRLHLAALTGQQFQSPAVDPFYVLFEDFTHVKFYRRSFFDVVEVEVGRSDGRSHVDNGVPHRLVTSTAATPRPSCGNAATWHPPRHRGEHPTAPTPHVAPPPRSVLVRPRACSPDRTPAAPAPPVRPPRPSAQRALSGQPGSGRCSKRVLPRE